MLSRIVYTVVRRTVIDVRMPMRRLQLTRIDRQLRASVIVRMTTDRPRPPMYSRRRGGRREAAPAQRWLLGPAARWVALAAERARDRCSVRACVLLRGNCCCCWCRASSFAKRDRESRICFVISVSTQFMFSPNRQNSVGAQHIQDERSKGFIFCCCAFFSFFLPFLIALNVRDRRETPPKSISC